MEEQLKWLRIMEGLKLLRLCHVIFVALLCSLLSSVHFVPSIHCNDFDDPVSLQSVQPRSNNDFLMHM